jgi:hypothetical protein
MSFHDEAYAEIGESQFINTDEMPRSPGMIKSWHDINKKTEIARSSRAMTVFEGLRAFPWIPDPVKDRSGMTE